MAGAGIAIAAVGAVVSAVGVIQAGDASKAQADAQAVSLRQQAVQEKAKAALEAADFRKRASAAAASNRAAAGSSGLQIGTGSSLLAAEDFITEAAAQEGRIKLGGDINANRLESQANLTKAAGESARRSSRFRAGGTVLSGFSSAFASFAGPKVATGGAKTVISGGNQSLLPPRRF